MEFGKKKTIEPLEISDELAKHLYPTEKPEDVSRDYIVLNKICEVFKNRAEIHSETSNSSFVCYIERMAFDAFVRFADDTYQARGHEATGLIVGYYFQDKNHPETTFIVGTNFLKATGPTTRVTCEFSYEDGVKHSNYCGEHKVLPLIWIHSHPGFGAFYSGTDDSTIRTYYYAPYQVGVVVDNLQKQILGYKMYGENKRHENIYIFDLDRSTSDNLCLVYTKIVINNTVKMVNTPFQKKHEKTTIQEPVSEQKENNKGKEGKNTVQVSSTEKKEDKSNDKSNNNEDEKVSLEPKEVSEPENKNVSDILHQKAVAKMMIKGIVGTSAIMLLLLLMFFYFINRNVQTQVARIDELKALVLNLAEKITVVQESVEENTLDKTPEQSVNLSLQSQEIASVKKSAPKTSNKQPEKTRGEQLAKENLSEQGSETANTVVNKTDDGKTTTENPTQDNTIREQSDTTQYNEDNMANQKIETVKNIDNQTDGENATQDNATKEPSDTQTDNNESLTDTKD